MKKQVIVMRADLNMRKGKMVAQGAHASMKAVLDRGCVHDGQLHIPLDTNLDGWLNGSFTKICVKAENLPDVLEAYHQALKLEIPSSLIVDSGKTEFGGMNTITCCAIGPADSDVIDTITGHFKLI